jgi:phenylalanyl-tRNA synthetase beta chain
MKLSLNWLKEFVDLTADPRQLKSDLTMIGLNAESMAQVGDDWVFEVEVTTNRPDCLNHYGVARELATLYRQSLKKIEVSLKESGGPARGAIALEISDPDLCARYCGRVVQNVQVKTSPGWLAERLEAVGQRPINNVADVTNYVLLELGHPLHAFDLSRLGQQRIVVRRAKPGELLRTLDGVDRTLGRDNLVIADGTRAVALAGVMGGEESEISACTRSVLLESAWFEPVSIRRTAKSQGMHTEASHRFERGADIEMAPLALDRAAALIQEVAGGEILQGMVDVYPRSLLQRSLLFRRSEIRRILGTSIAAEEVERILRGLGFLVEPADGESWRIGVPSFRLDISREVDLVEEVARHVGYDRLPARVRTAPPRLERDTARDKVLAVSSLLVGLGFREIIAPSMIDPAECKRFAAAPPVILANPLSQDASALRSSAVPSMLHAIRWNLDRDTNEVRFFELGKTYDMSAEGAPQERRVLTLGCTGHRRPASVYDNEAPFDFFDLKGVLEIVLGAFDLPVIDFDPWGTGVPPASGHGQVRFADSDGVRRTPEIGDAHATAGRTYYQPGWRGRLSSQHVALAVFGQIPQDLARHYKLRQTVWVAEIDFERLVEFPLRSRKYQPFSRFPAVERDFSLVVPDAVSYAQLSSALTALALEEIRGFHPVDRYRGGSIPARHYSLLLRVIFQSQTQTLTSEEIGRLSQRLLTALEPLGVRLRA